MPFCPKCKVSLAGESPRCPLCNEKSVESLEPSLHVPVSYASDIRDADEREKLSPAEKRRMVFELLCVSFGILLFVTISVDFLFFRDLVWSQYTSIVFIMLWLFTAVPLLLWGHPALVCAVLSPSLLAGVFLWVAFTGNLSAFLLPAMLIALFLEITVTASYALIWIQKRRGLNTVGVILAAAGLLSAGVNAVVYYQLHGALALSWSVIVIISVMPVAAFFFYLHYRVVNRASLRKIFRL